MKPLLLYFVSLCCILFASCANKQMDADFCPLGLSSVDSPDKSDDNSYYIDQNGAISLLEKLLPSRKMVSLEIEHFEGTPLLYIINFDSGWGIVSCTKKIECPILAFGEKGTFYPDEINSPEVLFWYESLKKYAAFYVSEGCEVKTKNNLEDVPYYWAKIRYSPDVSHLEESHVDRLTYTRWGQLFPWNINSPFFYQQCYTGCVATAVAQLFYYLHYSIGAPNALYEAISPSYQSFYDAELGWYYWVMTSLNGENYQMNSLKWTFMPLCKSGSASATLGERYVADLMSEIGYSANMNYYPFGSGATMRMQLLNEYGITCDSLDHYDFDIVKQSLDAESPVIIAAGSGTSRHAWIIDGYRESESYVIHTNLWKTVSSDSLAYVNAVQFYTEEEKQALYPDVEENEIAEEKEIMSSIRLLRMNWGSDLSNNDVAMTENSWYSAAPIWYYNNTPVYSMPIIYYNFSSL